MNRSTINSQVQYAVKVEGGLSQTVFARSQEEAYAIVERMTGRKAIRDPSYEAINAKRNGAAPETTPSRTVESAEALYARRERERVEYKGPGPNESSGAEADADFARRAAQTEASKR